MSVTERSYRLLKILLIHVMDAISSKINAMKNMTKGVYVRPMNVKKVEAQSS